MWSLRCKTRDQLSLFKLGKKKISVNWTHNLSCIQRVRAWNKGVWELNKPRLSLRASSTSKGEAQKETAALCCPRAAQWALQGSCAPRSTALSPSGTGERAGKWWSCASRVMLWAAQNPECSGNDRVNISQPHAACCPHSRCFYNRGGQAERERGAEKSELCSMVKPSLHQTSFFEVISHPHKHFPTSWSNRGNPPGLCRISGPLLRGWGGFCLAKAEQQFPPVPPLWGRLPRAEPDSHFTEQGGGPSLNTLLHFFPAQIFPAIRFPEPPHTHSSTGTNTPNHREDQGGFTFPLQLRLFPGKSQEHV